MNVTYISHMGDDLMVANAARVSFAKHVEEFRDQDAKLIRYLAEHNHWTPFSHPQICLRIKAPIFVARQLFKHKVGLTENEISRRYVDDEPEFYHPVWRKRNPNAKQGSLNEFPANLDMCDAVLISAHKIALKAYNMLLEEGVAPEQARMVLPQSMYTEWYWTGSLAAYSRVCRQRLDSHAQSETREVAQMISDVIEPLFPVSWRVLVEQ